MAARATLPPPLWDTVLRRTPVHVFLLDTGLICRYAAPVGDEFLGRPREQLVGRHVSEILPPANNGLRLILERSLVERAVWQHDDYRFTCPGPDDEILLCWRIRVEPVAAGSYRGLLVSVSDVREIVEQRDSLRLEVARLRRRDAERRRALLQLYADLRTQLTPISGYLQLIARRPKVLSGHSVSRIVAERVLPPVQCLTVLLDRLLPPPGEEIPSARPPEIARGAPGHPPGPAAGDRRPTCIRAGR